MMAGGLAAFVTPLDLAPPLLFKKTIDDYLVPGFEGGLPLAKAWNGGLLISLAYLGVLIFDFLAQSIQIRIMQRVGQQTMYDMRTAIFGRLQRLPMTY